MTTALEPLVRVADDERRDVEATSPRPRLLIVDDEDEVRHLFTRLLRAEGYEVRAVATAVGALETVADWHPDAILLDYRMPFVNGVGFLYRLRAHESASRTPVAMITGVWDVNGVLSTECATLGSTVYFKPLGCDGLRKIVRALLTSNGSPMH